MSEKDKQLLLKYLCSGLPYGTICYYETSDKSEVIIGKLGFKTLESFVTNKPLRSEEVDDKVYDYSVVLIKPYLRPMSSMTDEEKRELRKKYNYLISNSDIQIHYHSDGYWDTDTECSFCDYVWLIGWLNSHHFDYRGLIEKGLALEAPEGMYDLKDK